MPNDDSVEVFIARLADAAAGKPDVVVANAWAGEIPAEVRERFPTGGQLLDRVTAELRRRDEERYLALLRQSVGASLAYAQLEHSALQPRAKARGWKAQARA